MATGSRNPRVRISAPLRISRLRGTNGAKTHLRAPAAENKPILLDVGAVWCHWCHVIDRESYENPEIAALINKFFIPVKVDRDERPDVDARYQSAVSAVSGQGGWPLTGFLTAGWPSIFRRHIFSAGRRHGASRFSAHSAGCCRRLRESPRRVENARPSRSPTQFLNPKYVRGARGNFDPGVIEQTVNATLELFDREVRRLRPRAEIPAFPGRGSASRASISKRVKSASLHIAERTLVNMACGGVYDQLAGGFHRYSVDERWLVPHFEKMSYDNSELLKNYRARLSGDGQTILSRSGRRNYRLGESDAFRPGKMAAFTPARTPTIRSTTTAIISPGRSTNCAPCFLRKKRVSRRLHFDVEAHGEMHHNPAKNVLWIARGAAEISAQIGKIGGQTSAAIIASARQEIACGANSAPHANY